MTDATSATGIPDGDYQLGGFTVQVANSHAMSRSVLAGSVLTQDRALTNFIEFAGAPLGKALRLLTTNQLRMFGMTKALAVGSLANLAVVDAGGRLVATMIEGRLVER